MIIITIIGKIAIVAGVLTALFCIFMMIKNKRTANNHLAIVRAIHEYEKFHIHDGTYVEGEVSHDQMEPYAKTLWRLNDWGFENILPRESFEKVRPFIAAKGGEES